NKAAEAVNLDRLEDIAGRWRRVGREERFGPPLRAIREVQGAIVVADCSLLVVGAGRECLVWLTTLRTHHDLLHVLGRTRDTARADHRAVIAVSYPHANHQLRREANRPVVLEVVGRARLDCRRASVAQVQRGAKLVAPRYLV